MSYSSGPSLFSTSASLHLIYQASCASRARALEHYLQPKSNRSRPPFILQYIASQFFKRQNRRCREVAAEHLSNALISTYSTTIGRLFSAVCSGSSLWTLDGSCIVRSTAYQPFFCYSQPCLRTLYFPVDIWLRRCSRYVWHLSLFTMSHGNNNF